MAAARWYGRVHEDGSYSVLGRVTALDGTGSEVVAGEGNCLKQADVSSMSAKVYDLGASKDNPAGTEILPAPTLAAANNILDTLRTVGWPTSDDPWGYNFRHDLSPSYAPDGGEWVLIEYTITLVAGIGGGVVRGEVVVNTLAKQSG